MADAIYAGSVMLFLVFTVFINFVVSKHIVRNVCTVASRKATSVLLLYLPVVVILWFGLRNKILHSDCLTANLKRRVVICRELMAPLMICIFMARLACDLLHLYSTFSPFQKHQRCWSFFIDSPAVSID